MQHTKTHINSYTKIENVNEKEQKAKSKIVKK